MTLHRSLLHRSKWTRTSKFSVLKHVMITVMHEIGNHLSILFEDHFIYYEKKLEITYLFPSRITLYNFERKGLLWEYGLLHLYSI
jgi:hypothetical protein